MARPKITVVGAGNVGGTTAQRLAERNVYDVVLVDIIRCAARESARYHAGRTGVRLQYSCGWDQRV